MSRGRPTINKSGEPARQAQFRLTDTDVKHIELLQSHYGVSTKTEAIRLALKQSVDLVRKSMSKK